ncbi:MAG: winged helix-turn-helix domain-containing protein [Alphaproteobacteria bacterium]
MTKLLFLSDNQDLKKQIASYATEIEFVEENPDIILIDDDEEKVLKYKNYPIILLTNKTFEAENIITIKKPFSLKVFFEKLFSAQKIFENNSSFFLKWNNFKLFINKKELLNTKLKVSFKLTEKEVEVLKYFYKNKEKFISKKELLENVWGYNPEMSTHTTETHIYRLRQKVEPTSESLIETLDGEYKLV